MNINIVLDVVIIVFGFYVIFLGVSMHKKGEINDTIMPVEEKNKIKKPKEFIAFIYPRFVFFGACVAIISAVSLVSDTVYEIPYWTMVQLVLFLVVLLYFSQKFKEAKNRFSRSFYK